MKPESKLPVPNMHLNLDLHIPSEFQIYIQRWSGFTRLAHLIQRQNELKRSVILESLQTGASGQHRQGQTCVNSERNN